MWKSLRKLLITLKFKLKHRSVGICGAIYLPTRKGSTVLVDCDYFPDQIKYCCILFIVHRNVCYSKIYRRFAVATDASSSPVVKIIHAYLSVYLLAVMLGIFISSYFDQSIVSMLSFSVDDGWCNSDLQGVGAHCFGDFYYVLNFINQDNPWTSVSNPYPPVALLIFKPFAIIVGLIPNSPWGLFTYLGFMIASVLTIPVHLYLLKKIDIFQSFYVGLLMLTSSPVIIALDRGNVILLCVPLLYFFLHFESTNDSKRSFTFWVALVLIKPQFSLLGLLFLRNRNIKEAFKRLILGFCIFFTSFLIYPIGIIENIKEYFKQLVGYQDYGSLGNVFPVNISLGSALSLVDVFNKTILTGSTQTISVVVLIATVLVTYRSSAKLSLSVVLSVLLLPIILPQTSWHYYLVVLIPFFVIAITDTPDLKIRIVEMIPKNLSFRLQNYLQIGLAAWATLLFVPWVIPWNVFAPNDAYFGASSISMHWLLVTWSLPFCLIGSLIYSELSKRQSSGVREK
jgi:hypothetical protein